MDNFINLITKRRSIYNLEASIPLTDKELEGKLKEVILNMPTSFNMQNTRMVLLLNENHNKLWSIVLETLRKIVPEENFGKTEAKIKSFNNGYGTILYFDDVAVVEKYSSEYPIQKEDFPIWSLQQGGMLQFAIWTMLANNNIGASLQHYNPLIDNAVKEEWKIPDAWKLLAQMPFGKIAKDADIKEFEPIEKRMLIFE